jgi:tRNA1(Val) A37 N6-methylase TrmN6
MGHEDEKLSVRQWIDVAHFCLKSNGSLTMIHRADKLDRMILALGKRFGAVEIFPLWPKAGEHAKRVILRAIKDRKSPATLHAGLALHTGGGDYTPEAQKVLRDAEKLF